MSRRRAIDSLTGLCGIAALLVVMNRLFFWCSPYKVDTVPPWIASLFGTSDLGMTLFFTLSGFVIAYNYIGSDWERSPLSSTARFMFLRFLCLFSALLVFMLIAVANSREKILALFETNPEASSLWLGFHLFSLETWFPVKFDGVLPIDSIFHVSWSISTEFMLYLMFVAAMIMWFCFTQSRTGILVLIALAVTYVAVAATLAISPALFQLITSWIDAPIEPLTDTQWRRWFFYLSPYFRVLNFSFGVAAALLILREQKFLAHHRKALRNLAVIAVVAVTVFQLGILTRGVGAGHAWVPAFAQLATAAMFSVVMLNGEDDTTMNRLLSSHPRVFVGKISYSLYLFHFLSPRIGVMAPGGDFAFKYFPMFVFNFGVTLFLAIVFAAGMYHLLEQPAQKLLRRLLPISKGHNSSLASMKARSAIYPDDGVDGLRPPGKEPPRAATASAHPSFWGPARPDD